MIPFVKAHACGNDFLVVQEISPAPGRATLWRAAFAAGTMASAPTASSSSPGKPSGRAGSASTTPTVPWPKSLATGPVVPPPGWLTKPGWPRRRDLSRNRGRPARLPNRRPQRPALSITSPMGVPEISQRNWRLPAESGSKAQSSLPAILTSSFSSISRISTIPLGVDWRRDLQPPRVFPAPDQRRIRAHDRRDEIEIRIYERGVGPTSSSGTGTCAAASASIALRGAEPVLRVTAPGGAQTVHWQGPGSEMLLTGPAELICFGETW